MCLKSNHVSVKTKEIPALEIIYLQDRWGVPSLLWHCWIGVRKSIRPAKNWVMRCWCGYLSRERCKWSWFCIWFSWCHCHPIISCFIKIHISLSFWCQLVPLLTNRDISSIRRGRLYSSCVRSSMQHGSETWPVRKENEVALQRAEMRVVRWMCNVKVIDRVVRSWEKD